MVRPCEICMIGDRVLTDIVFANQHKMHSVLVRPLSQTRDHPVAVLIRWVTIASSFVDTDVSTVFHHQVSGAHCAAAPAQAVRIWQELTDSW